MESGTLHAAPVHLTGLTWDHPRGVDGLRSSNQLLVERHGVAIEWEARSLTAFGNQHVATFADQFDVMVIDYPNVPDAVAAGALVALDAVPGIDEVARESVGRSHEPYCYRGKQWALGLDAAAQVSVFRPDRSDGAPKFWSNALEMAKAGAVLWPYKPVDKFITFATLLSQRDAPLTRHFDGSQSFIDRSITAEVLGFLIQLSRAVPGWCADANPIDVAEAPISDEVKYTVGVMLFGSTNYSRPGFRRHLLVYHGLTSFDGRSAGSTLGGAGIPVSASTGHRDLALAAAAPRAGADAQRGAHRAGGGQPVNARTWRSEEMSLLVHGFFGDTLRTLERAWVGPLVTGWPDLQLALSHRVRIVRPVRIADAVTAESEIVVSRAHEKRPEQFGIAEEHVRIVNQRDEVVVAFGHVYIINRRPGSFDE